jgi:photosystem II stability/assembly factor-like uncharacterized protein
MGCNMPANSSAMPTLMTLNTPAAPATPVLAPLPGVVSPQIVLLQMLDAANGWGLSPSGVLRTTDGGATWGDATPPGVTSVGEQASAFFLDERTGWVLVPGSDYSSGTLYRTIDGGASWATSALPFSGAQFQFRDASNGMALVSLGAGAGSEAVAVYATADGGGTWTQVFVNDPNATGFINSLPLGGQKNGISFLDASRGWVGGEEPMNDFIYLFVTGDGGRTWAHQDVAMPAGFSGAMTMVDAPHFYGASDAVLPVFLTADTQSMVFYLSHDGGATWTTGLPTAPSGHYSVASLKDLFVWDGGATMHVSHDSGASWNVVSPNISVTDTLLAFQFIDATTGWALTLDAGGHYSLYKTGDGGTTWSALIP